MIRPVAAAVALVLTSTQIHAADVESVLDCVADRQAERFDGIRGYALVQSVMGHQTTQYFRIVSVTDAEGDSHDVPVAVDAAGYRSAVTGEKPQMTSAEFLNAYATGLDMTGDAVAAGVEEGLADAGLPPGALAASGRSPTATLDPRVMLGPAGDMLREVAAEGSGGSAPDSAAAEAAAAMSAFEAAARLVGSDEIDGRRAHQIRADDLDQTHAGPDGTFTVNAIDLWVDAEWCVPLKMRMEATATTGGQTRPMVIEQLKQAYREVPGSRLFEPYRQVTRVGGMLDPAQQAEMARALQELEKMEAQLAGMPESQRRMVENMMGGQLQQLRSMAAGGMFETVIETVRIAVDEPL